MKKDIWVNGQKLTKQAVNPNNAAGIIASYLTKQGHEASQSNVLRAMRVTRNAFSYHSPEGPGELEQRNTTEAENQVSIPVQPSS